MPDDSPGNKEELIHGDYHEEDDHSSKEDDCCSKEDHDRRKDNNRLHRWIRILRSGQTTSARMGDYATTVRSMPRLRQRSRSCGTTSPYMRA